MKLDAPGAITAADAFAGVTFVQEAAGYSSPWEDGGSTIAATFSNEVTAGDVIALYVTYADDTSVKSVTDSLGNTFATVDGIDDDDNGQKAGTAYVISAATGVDTVTVKLDDSACCRVVIVHELHGADPSAPLDGHSAHEGNANTSLNDATSDAMTTTSNRDYIFAATSNSSNASGEVITAGTGMQLRAKPSIPDGNPTVTEDSTQLQAGTTASTFTFSSGGAALTMQMAFKP